MLAVQTGMRAVPAGMERVPMNREGQALRQLGTVSQLRQLRLRREREALAARERTLADALLRQQQDEQLLLAQHQACRQRWLDWRAQGGALATALRWRAEREQLAELAALLAQRRAALQQRQQQLAGALAQWALRWQAAMCLDDDLATRRLAVRRAHEAAAERLRDEEALLCRPLGTGLARVVPAATSGLTAWP